MNRTRSRSSVLDEPDRTAERVIAARRAHAHKHAKQVRDALRSRYLPPVYSPIPHDAFWGSVRDELFRRDDPRPGFAAHLRQQYRADCAALFGSGTQALAAAIRAAKRLVGGHTPVALPAYACFDVAAAAVSVDSSIALYDVDAETLAPCPESLEAALSAGARIVVVAPLWGVPPDWDAITRRVAAHDGVLIEDAAQGLGSSWHAQRAGTHAALSVLSFGRGKGWTGGSGGALLARGDAVDAVPLPTDTRSASPVNGIARVAVQRALGEPDMYAVPAALPFLHLGETRYRRLHGTHPISSIAVRLLERTWTEAHREAAIRRRNARGYRDAIARVGTQIHLRPHPMRIPAHARAGYLRFPVRVLHGWSGLEDEGLARQAGVAPGYPSTLAEIPDVRDRMAVPTGEWRWPGAERLVRELVTLPTHSFVTDADRAAALRAVGAPVA